ncbi:hypothetical protein BDR04DRAFT_1123787, partial [Suillus decipiens]
MHIKRRRRLGFIILLWSMVLIKAKVGLHKFPLLGAKEDEELVMNWDSSNKQLQMRDLCLSCCINAKEQRFIVQDLAKLSFHLLSFNLVLVVEQIQMNTSVMKLQKCNHHTLVAVIDSPYGHSGPVRNDLGSCSIAIMANAIEKDSKLNCDGELGIVQ